jgi:uncharacterized protein (TIGR00369 family)
VNIQQKTHRKINEDLCGTPQLLNEGYSRIKLVTSKDMIVDDHGLIHGGFTFALADYAAMLAVNHPNVVLVSADVKFIKPVVLNETLIAEGNVTNSSGKRKEVIVTVKKKEEKVFEGIFQCYITKDHILERDK